MRKLEEITIEIIQKCSNNCIHCSSRSNMLCNNILDFETIKYAINDASFLGAKRINISGGEPFLHPDILNIIEYAKNKNMEVYLYSSGILNIDNKYQSIDKDKILKLKDIGLDKIIFNIQAITEDLYNTIMNTNGCLNLLKESIKLCTSLGIYTEIHFVPMKINIEDIENIIHFCKEYKVNKISFLRLVLQGRAKDNAKEIDLTQDDIIKFKQKVLNISEYINNEVDIRLGIPLTEKIDTNICKAGREKIVLKYDGSILPCEVFKDIIYVLKDGKKIYPDNINLSTLIESYNTSKYLNKIRDDIDLILETKQCSNCPIVELKYK